MGIQPCGALDEVIGKVGAGTGTAVGLMSLGKLGEGVAPPATGSM
jgi:hypothetical protein